MAKRPKSRKTARKPARRTRARKTTTRKVRAATEAIGPRTRLPLRDLRLELDAAIANWSKRMNEPKVERAVTMFKRWQSDIALICEDPSGSPCGPTMDPMA